MEEAKSLYLDLHIHSHYSKDSLQSPRRIIEASLKKGLSGIAIVDHDTISGGLEAKEVNKTNLEIIVGIEIKTEFGDVVGLFLEKEVYSRNFFSLVQEIKDQGGLVMLPHPFKKHRLEPEFLKEIDLIEVFNARLNKSLNDKAQDLAEEQKLPVVAGSDAHFHWEIGRGVLKIKKNQTSSDLKNTLLSAEREIIHKYSNPFWEVLSQGIKFSRKAKSFKR
jgi:predicted metal-dependent phosphoesterase TrpH